MDGSHVQVPGCQPFSTKRQPGAFTLVEMLVSTVILLIIMAVVLGMTTQTGKAWRDTEGKTEVFRNARTAFDAMTRTISQATLNTYYDYATASAGSLSFIPLGSTTVPTTYGRNSDLQIVSGQGATLLPSLTSNSGTAYTAVTHAIFFQAPLGYNTVSNFTSLDSLVNTCGFYVAYGPDPARPSFLAPASRYRYRLMQFLQSSSNLGIYQTGSGPNKTAQGTNAWYYNPVQTDVALASPVSDFVLSENIIALIILPKLATKDEAAAEQAYGVGVCGPMGTAIAPAYAYDSSTPGQGGSYNLRGTSSYPLLNSRNQLPPVIQVTMVALDEVSALKLGNPSDAATANTKLGLSSGLFTQASNLQADLATLQTALIAAHLNFRVFQTNVAIRGSKWTGNN